VTEKSTFFAKGLNNLILNYMLQRLQLWLIYLLFKLDVLVVLSICLWLHFFRLFFCYILSICFLSSFFLSFWEWKLSFVLLRNITSIKSLLLASYLFRRFWHELAYSLWFWCITFVACCCMLHLVLSEQEMKTNWIRIHYCVGCKMYELN
jgi:hypothetical protein